VRETSRGPDLDLKSRRNVQDPFPLYARLRDHDPVHWSESLNAWGGTRYEDVVQIFDRPATFSADRFRKIDERYASQRPAVGRSPRCWDTGSCSGTLPTTTACAGCWRLPDLALAPGAPRWKPMIFLRGLESLPLTWGSG